MFERLQNKLTATYMVIFSAFLLIFVFFMFHVNVMSFVNEEEIIMQSMLQHEADEYLNASRHGLNESNYIKNEVENQKLFVYLMDNNVPLIDQLSNDSKGRLLLDKRNEWPIINKETQIICIKEEGKRNFYLVGVRYIYDQENDQAKLYLFKDLTIYYNALITSTGIVVLLILFFIAVSGYLGYFLAGKNLAPLKKSYQQGQRFIADASHELRTPLAIITMAVDGIRNDKENKLSDFSQNALDDLHIESQRMRRLINDLLTLARSETPVVEIRKELFNLNETVIAVLAGLQTLAAQKNIELCYHDAASRIMISADKERIIQLITILVDNAIKYSFVRQEIKIYLKCRDENVEFSVEDSGQGMSETDKEKIFERFFRVDKERSKLTGGFGLGLAIALWIVQAHGGRIEVTTKLGRGSCFKVFLPLD